MKSLIFKSLYKAMAFVGSLIAVGIFVLSVMVFGCISGNDTCSYEWDGIGSLTVNRIVDDNG